MHQFEYCVEDNFYRNTLPNFRYYFSYKNLMLLKRFIVGMLPQESDI